MKYQEKIIEWSQMYLKYIRDVGVEHHVKNEEGYKFESVQNFQTNFNIEATDLAGNLELSIINNNLVTGAQYWPLKMLIHYAQIFPDETRTIVRDLFNETNNVSERITKAKKEIDKLHIKRNTQLNESSANTYIGLRFLSLLLAYRYPEKYNPLKPAEWKVFARFLNDNFKIPNHTEPGIQYEIYSDYIEPLREYIKSREDITEIKSKLTEKISFKDDEYRWTAQDIIYITAKILANERSNESIDIVSNDQEIKTTPPFSNITDENEKNGFMPLEKYLEDYIVSNWQIIDFGEELSLYYGDDGTPAKQYTTDVGIIDILARDKKNNFVVIELKKATENYKVVGQILNYMGWVKDNLATKSQTVRGLIIVGNADNTLKSALSQVSEKITLKEYRIKMKLVEPNI